MIINQNLYTFNYSQTGQRQDSSNILRQSWCFSTIKKNINRNTVTTLSQNCHNTVTKLSKHCHNTVTTLSKHCHKTVTTLCKPEQRSFCAAARSVKLLASRSVEPSQLQIEGGVCSCCTHRASNLNKKTNG